MCILMQVINIVMIDKFQRTNKSIIYFVKQNEIKPSKFVILRRRRININIEYILNHFVIYIDK